MAQLAEWLLPTPEVRGLNPVISMYVLLTAEETKENKEKEAEKGLFLTNLHLGSVGFLQVKILILNTMTFSALKCSTKSSWKWNTIYNFCQS